MDNDLFEIVSVVLNTPIDNLSLESGPDNIQTWDSLGHVALCTAIEQSYQCQLTMSEMLAIRNIADIKQILKKYGFGS